MARIVKVGAAKYGKPYEVRWSWYDESGKRRFGSERYRSEREAKAKKREVESRIADGATTDNQATRKVTVAEYAQRFLREKEHDTKRRTLESYDSILRTHVLPVFGHRRLRSVSTADVSDFVLRLAERGLAPSTTKHAYGTLRGVLALAARDHVIAVNPALGVRLPRGRDRAPFRPRFLTAEQVESLAQSLDANPPYGLLIRFAAFTGLRAGELAGLAVGDVLPLHGPEPAVRVRRTRRKIKGGWETSTTKSGRERSVPLPRWLADDLVRYLGDEHPHGSDLTAPLWPGRRVGGHTHGQDRGLHRPGELIWVDGHYWDRDGFYKRQFKPALRAAGLPEDVRLHDLRHSYASICASAGIPAYRVAAYMGHASEVVTRMIYTHLFADDATADMERLDRPVSIKSAREPPSSPRALR